MEHQGNPNITLKPPPLNSDQLNYLIWRYLQEAGYGEAAVKLQRDWKLEPDSLPFAKHVKGQALVSLVQKGLRYHHLSLTIDDNGQPLKQLNPSTFFFGAESGRPTSPGSSKEPLYRLTEASRGASPSTSTVPKKRETELYGPPDLTLAPTKRNRKTTTNDRNGNGVRKTSASTSDMPMGIEVDYVNGTGGSLRSVRSPSVSENVNDENAMNGVGLDSRMDVDMRDITPGAGGIDQTQQDVSELQPPPLIHTLTNGESVGIQVAPAKIANLEPSTTILSLPERSHVSRTIWRPADEPLLTAAGEHFCGVWRNTTSASHDNGSAGMVYQDLLSYNESVLISAVAWNPRGGLLAIATYSDQTGQLHLFDGRELVLIENLPASQRAITSLKWLPSSSSLIGIAPYEDQSVSQGTSSTILLWDFAEMQLSAPPSTLTVPDLLLDVDSAHHKGHDMICAAGGNAVYYCRASKELLVEQTWSLSTGDGLHWAFVKCSSQNENNPLIVAASSENARLWLPRHDVVSNDVHDAPITGLEIRPRSFQGADPASGLDFASSSMDGSIKIWHFDPTKNTVEILHKLSIDRRYPIMSLAYSPDGFCLAGASFSTARIWNAEHGYNLMASWEGTNEQWRGATLKDEDVMSAGGLSSINGDGAISNDHSLAWDGDSKKLAFGLASQVAVINFQR